MALKRAEIIISLRCQIRLVTVESSASCMKMRLVDIVNMQIAWQGSSVCFGLTYNLLLSTLQMENCATERVSVAMDPKQEVDSPSIVQRWG